MLSRKTGLNRLVAELVEHASDGGLRLRKWVLPQQKDRVDATSITSIKWEYTSTICPDECAKKKQGIQGPADVAVGRALALHGGGWRGQRVLLEPRVKPSADATRHEQEAYARNFFDDTSAWCRRINPELRQLGVELGFEVQHAGILDGQLVPHMHLVPFIHPDLAAIKVSTKAIRSLIDLLLVRDQVGAVVALPRRGCAGWMSANALARHVSYLHGYPITAYDKPGDKNPLRDVVEKSPSLFLAAVSALACPAFTFKGTVIMLGPIRRKPLFLSQKQTGTIHVDESEPVATDREPKEPEKGLVACSATQPQRIFGVRDPWEARPRGKRRRKRRKKGPKKAKKPIKPVILHIITRDSALVTGMKETIAILRGVRGWSRAQIEEFFPLLGEKWRRERAALRMNAAGLRDETVMKSLSKARSRALKIRMQAPSRPSRGERIEAMVARSKTVKAAA